ncbi:MAG TPA: fumarylacetoacetate hydrolase family protein [Verrucomicrobiae bacterium]|nr:fumarylacetoacetate hydrolase family protein [Verrucomicrobiae bacterium]
MKICRFENSQGKICAGLVTEDNGVLDLTSAGIESLASLLEVDSANSLSSLASQKLPRHKLTAVRLLAPVERQEIWAAGVTYLRSKKARMEESDSSATAYDKVYDAVRPELFFKCVPGKVVNPGGFVGIRSDAKWNVPEPELALVINSRGDIAGFTVGNDMSSRDIEGENLLYLPQAKIYNRSCAIGPFITVGSTEAEARAWKIEITIERDGAPVFQGDTTAGQIKRTFAELVEHLFRSQTFPDGVLLLTGTGIVPPSEFTLRPNDKISIAIAGIGKLENTVATV